MLTKIVLFSSNTQSKVPHKLSLKKNFKKVKYYLTTLFCKTRVYVIRILTNIDKIMKIN